MSKKRASSIRPPPAVRPPPTDGRPKNRLLAALPDDDFRRIRRHLKTVPLSPKQVLLKRGEPIRYLYFPNGGVCSVNGNDEEWGGGESGDGVRSRLGIAVRYLGYDYSGPQGTVQVVVYRLQHL